MSCSKNLGTMSPLSTDCGSSELDVGNCGSSEITSVCNSGCGCESGCGCSTACQEDHTQKIIYSKYSAAFKVNNSWNVPVCGGTATLIIPDLTVIHIGSNLWSSSFGYFEVTAFNDVTKQVTVKNNCADGNASAGTVVPACSSFIVTDPPAPSSSDSGVCLELDFTAPLNGQCTLITVSSTDGVQEGGLIQIGTGIYRVDSIPSAGVIKICNEGEGIAGGTPVIAKNAAGDYNYCLSIIIENLCESDTVDSGIVIVCSEGRMRPLSGGDNLGVLTKIDDATGEAQFRSLTDLLCGFPIVTLGDVPLASITIPITIASYKFEYDHVASLKALTLPTICDTYSIEAAVSVAAISNHSTGVVYHEVELYWDPVQGGNPRTGGKMVWTDFGSDGYDVAGVYPTWVSNFVTMKQLASAGSLKPMMYHQNDITAWSTGLAAGSTHNLKLAYRCAVGDNNEPATLDSIQLMISGIVRIYKA